MSEGLVIRHSEASANWSADGRALSFQFSKPALEGLFASGSRLPTGAEGPGAPINEIETTRQLGFVSTRRQQGLTLDGQL